MRRSRASRTLWFDPEMNCHLVPTGSCDRRRTGCDATIPTCLPMKVLFGMVDIGASLVRATVSARQTTGFGESPLRLVGLDWRVPCLSTPSRRRKALAMNIPYRCSKGPLHLLIDCTRIKVEREGEWHARKHGGPKRVRHCALANRASKASLVRRLSRD